MFHSIRKIILSSILILALAGNTAVPAYPSAASAAPEPHASAFNTSHLLLRLHPEVSVKAGDLQTHVSSLDATLAALDAAGFDPILGAQNTFKLKFNHKTDILAAVEKLTADPAVVYAEPDYLAELAETPDDPLFSQQWGLEAVQAAAAWDTTHGAPNVVIAVIDSGIDLEHEDLAPNLWQNPGEVPSNDIDDDNNGFVDDIQGWNFVNASNNVMDVSGHGSLVSGTAAARSNNALGIAGVCGQCRIMPVKITQDTGVINYSDIAAGIYYAAGKGAQVINLSLGGYSDSITVKVAVDYALSKNIVVVAGAGNDDTGSPFYPAAYQDVLSVAAVDPSGIKTASSNYGAWVDVSAPGEDILSTTLGDYASGSGTSYAAPFASGGAGLLLSLHPDWTPAMIRAQLTQTAADLDPLNPVYAGLLGAGRINLAAAMQPPHPELLYLGYTGNGIADLRPELGSTVNLQVTLTNAWADAEGVTGVLSSPDPYVSITTESASFGDILAGQSAQNAVPFVFSIDSSAGYSHEMAFALDLSANGGAYTVHLEYSITTRSPEEQVSGTLLVNTIWTSDKIYKVTGDIGVPPGLTLTIQPGTHVQFAGNYSLNIGGKLVAAGEPEAVIRFEPYSAGTTWNRIAFNDTSEDAQTSETGEYQGGNVLQYVALSGATGGIACTNATPFLNFLTTSGGGISCSLGATSLWMLDSTINGTVNISQSDSKPNHFMRVQVFGDSSSVPWAEVEDSSFSGLYIQGNGNVKNSSFGNLAIYAAGTVQNVTTRGNISISSGLVSDSSVTEGTIICQNTCSLLRNNLEIPLDPAITAGSGSVIAFNRMVRGEIRGIVAPDATIENNLIAKFGGDGLVTGASTIRNNTFVNNYVRSVYLTGAPLVFENNNFEFNTGAYDVYLDPALASPGEIQATDNWWGTTDLALIRQRTWDYYDDYTLAKLIVDPPLIGPSQNAPAYVRSVTLDPPSPVGIQTVNFTVEFSKPMDVNINSEITAMLSDPWQTKPGMPTARYLFGAAVSKDQKIYTIGGQYSYYDGTLSVVEEYDPQTETWSTRSPMPTPRWGGLGAATASNGKIYAIGGYKNSTVEEYDPEMDSWTIRASLPTPRGGLGVVAANNGKIYAIGGGYDEINSTNIVEEYNPFTDTWAIRSSMPTRRHELAVANASNGKIYAIGGRNDIGGGISTVEEYDPFTDTWSTKSPMPTARFGHGAVGGSDGKIYVIGGCGNFDLTSNVIEYDPVTDTWSNLSPLYPFRRYLSVVAIDNGKIYSIGGIEDGTGLILNLLDEFSYTPEVITSNPTWLDFNHFRSSHDISALTPLGEYEIHVSGAVGSDGIPIATDERTTFVVDYAGEISDTTPPPQPFVSAWGDGSLTRLYARAIVDDLESDIVAYRYAIGTTPGGTEVINWTDTPTPEITHTGLTLLPDQPYYVSFTARNTGGLWSLVGTSNPVINGAQLTSVFLPLLMR